MDTGDGNFRMLNETEAHFLRNDPDQRTSVFSIGEEVMIKDSRFKIVKITPKKLTLRLLPKE